MGLRRVDLHQPHAISVREVDRVAVGDVVDAGELARVASSRLSEPRLLSAISAGRRCAECFLATGNGRVASKRADNVLNVHYTYRLASTQDSSRA